MTRHATFIPLLAGLIACVTAGGCGHPNLNDFAKDYLGTRPVALGYLAFPEVRGMVSADAQREAIIEMSYRWWGADEAPVRGYSLVAQGGDQPPIARSAALRALARAGDKAVVHVERIIRSLDASSAHVRWDAAVALDSVVDEKAIPAIASHVTWDRRTRAGESSPDVRSACARALGNYRRTDVVAILAGVLENDDDLVVRWRAHDSLVELVGVDRGWTRRHWQSDTVELPPVAAAEKSWWDHVCEFFANDGGGDPNADGGDDGDDDNEL